MRVYLVCLCAVFIVTIFAIRAQQDTTRRQAVAVMAEKNECNKCHTSINNEKAIGPTYAQIAARYQNDTVSISVLIDRVKKGSKGKWTEISRGVPMPPYSGSLSDAEIRNLVEWVLRSKN
jgi:cytochrome c551/c552